MNPLFDQLFGRHRDSDAPFLHISDQRVSYRQFVARSLRMASVLRSWGIAPGDRLAVQVDKSPDALALYAACASQGIVLLPLNTAYTAPEVSYFVKDAGAALLITTPAQREALSDIAPRVETLNGTGRGTLGDAADTADIADPVARSEDDLAAFLYTSGTTGRSKGAMLSQTNLLSNALTLAEHWQFTTDDVLIHALPIFHTHGLFVATNVTLAAGGSMIFLPKFDIDAVLRAMPQATAMMGVPTFYTRLLGDDRLTRDVTRSMRLFVSGSAPMLEGTHHDWRQRTGHTILERYGMTETNMITSNPYDGERRPGTVGLPLPGVDLRICAPGTTTPMPQGETGVIEVRGPNVFQGYWQMPDKTKAELRPDGWFITGDLGKRDLDGYVTIVGRDKDLIIAGGYNIYPREVEEVIDDQPGVLESAVIGLAHPDMGEGVVAIVVPRDGAPPQRAQIEAAVSARLARYKQPRLYLSLAELPRNTMGKVQKAALRDRFADAFADASNLPML